MIRSLAIVGLTVAIVLGFLLLDFFLDHSAGAQILEPKPAALPFPMQFSTNRLGGIDRDHYIREAITDDGYVCFVLIEERDASLFFLGTTLETKGFQCLLSK